MMLLVLCVSAALFGAHPSDGVNDTPALQRALDAAGDVCLEPGDYEVWRADVTGLGNPDRLSDLRARGAVSLVGAGRGVTFLRMRGAGTRRMIDLLGVDSAYIADLTLDGAGRTATGEQTHLLHVSGGRNIVVEGVGFSLPELGPTTGGDCVKVIGGARDVTLRDVAMVACDRSGVTLHAVQGFTLTGGTFVGTGDSDIDLEPPAPGLVSDVIIEHVTIQRGRPGIAIALARVSRARVSDVRIQGGGSLFLLSARTAVLERVTAECPPGPCLTVRRGSFGVLARDLELVGAGGGSVVRVFADPDGSPANIVLDQVDVTQVGPEPAIEAVDVDGLYVLNSVLKRAGSPSQFAAVAVTSSPGMLHGNSYVGWERPLFMSPRAPGTAWFLREDVLEVAGP